MNANKAREYFSAYYEGAIDRGLKEGFERLIRQDAQVQAEYRAFERTMKQLESMSAAEPMVPDDLHDRIMARIDRQAWESRQKVKAPIFTWWKTSLLVAAAASVIGIAVVSRNRPADGTPISAAGYAGKAKLVITADECGVRLNYAPAGRHTVLIEDGMGNELERLTLDNRAIRDKSLSSGSAHSALVSVKVDHEPATWIALPGTKRDVGAASTGTLKEFAVAAADAGGFPVILQVGNPEKRVKWIFDSPAADQVTQAAIKAFAGKVELRTGGRGDSRALWILDE